MRKLENVAYSNTESYILIFLVKYWFMIGKFGILVVTEVDFIEAASVILITHQDQANKVI